MAQPFSVRQAVIVEGGWITRPWVPQLREVDGRCFLAMSNNDRDLARAMGMNMNERAPLSSQSLFAYLEKMRDDAVDALIRQRDQILDPLADSPDVSSPMKLPGAGRRQTFDTAAIPQLIDIALPAFVCDDGEQVAARSMAVIATPKRKVLVMIEATAGNLDWCRNAITVDWEMPNKKRVRHSHEEFPALLHAHVCKYKRLANKLYVQCRYTKSAGGSGLHTKLAVDLSAVEDRNDIKVLIRLCETAVLAFCEDNALTPLAV